LSEEAVVEEKNGTTLNSDYAVGGVDSIETNDANGVKYCKISSSSTRAEHT
jgi:hypothetical protein